MCVFNQYIDRMNQTQATINLPDEGSIIVKHDGVNYLVARLEENRTCAEYIEELKQGRPVVVPHSKRSKMTTYLKQQNIFTRQKALAPGLWVSFTPCPERKFKR